LRLWSLHPEHLDPQGLVALWRESLLAQKVLAGQTRGYTHHPQLERFRAHANPLACIATYLREITKEAARRGYSFDATKIADARTRAKLRVTRGQFEYEWDHLTNKLRRRSPRFPIATEPRLHPMFVLIEGPIAAWERVSSAPTPPRRRA
jgi:hypothetical protein